MKSKTRELLGSLTAHEQKAFRNYLNSPFFNCGIVELQLFEILIKDVHLEEKSKEDLYKMLVPGKKYDDKHLRYVISGLNKHLINFFVLRQLEKETGIHDSIAAKALSHRDCEKAFLMHHHDMVNSIAYQDAPRYYQQFETAELFLTYTGGKQNRKSTPDYGDTLLKLDAFYLAKKLQLSCEVANLSNILNTTYTIELAEVIKELAVKKPFYDFPPVTIYYHIHELLIRPESESHFGIVEQLLKLHATAFHPKELGEMYQYLKNFCVRKVNKGELDYLRTLFNIYSSMLANKSLMNYDYLSQWEFKNIVSISLRLNEKQWCGEFIHKYINYLKPGERENALAYNLSYFMFINNDFRKAIRKLQEVELNDVFYQLDARVILLKCYYELDDTDSFFYQASAFRLFLLRNRNISDYQKNIYRNLLKFLTAIVRRGTSRTKLLKLRDEIEKEKNVADLNWLRVKVKEAIGD